MTQPSKLSKIWTFFCACLVASAVSATDRESPRPGFSEETAGFAVKVKGEVIPYKVLALFVLPLESVHLEIHEPAPGDRYVVTTPQGRNEPVSAAGWRWSAPDQAGLYPIRVSREGSSHDVIDLNLFVILPFDRVNGGMLNGYKIGSYPLTPLKGLAIYKPPRGFIEVTQANENTLVSPHFRLSQFLCKQESEYPKYLVLNERLLLKLELILQHVNAAGHRADSFHLMSGYRTPFYNAAIGNVKYSRHIWGGAADIFVDVDPLDGVMDDLNRDGRSDYRDAAVLYELIDDLHGRSFYQPLIGGLARYEKTAAHGPFVHIDVRGFRARWGD